MNTNNLESKLKKLGTCLANITEGNDTLIYYLDEEGLRGLIRYVFVELADIDIETLAVSNMRYSGVDAEWVHETFIDLYEYLKLYQEKLMNTGYQPAFEDISAIVSDMYREKACNCSALVKNLDTTKRLQEVIDIKNEQIESIVEQVREQGILVDFSDGSEPVESNEEYITPTTPVDDEVTGVVERNDGPIAEELKISRIGK